MTRLVKGIILRKQDYRENDRLFVFYTDELGKIEAVAKGARKIKSKMAGHLDFFSIVNLMVAPGKTYYQIAGAETEKNFLNIKNDLAKIVLASACFEAVDIFTKSGHPDEHIYKLLAELVETFDDKKLKDFCRLYAVSKFFSVKMMSLLGWLPELYNCTKCKDKISPDGNSFDLSRGGLVCGKCRTGGLPISAPSIKILRFILENSLKKSSAIRISKPQAKELAEVADSFSAVHRDRESKNIRWISYLTESLEI